MKDIQQLIKKNSQEGRYENIFPKTYTDAVKDKESGKSLIDILSSFNMYFLSYNGSRELTRLQVPLSLRKTGLWITYVLYDKTVVTEWYAGEAIDDTSFSNGSNWRDGSNSLVGDISVSSDGYWVVNGVITTTKAQGEQGIQGEQGLKGDKGDKGEQGIQGIQGPKGDKGDTGLQGLQGTQGPKGDTGLQGEQGITPMLRVGSNNHLQASYTNGSSWVDVSTNPVYTQFRINNNKLEQSIDLGQTWTVVSDYIAAWFRFTGTTGSSQADNVGKIQISRDNGATWSDLSGEFTNSLHIKGYVATVGALPSSAVQGDIYGVGPTYDPSDTEHTNPIYQIYVKDSTGWINNGRFTSISAGVVQELGNSETAVMSQDAVSKEFASVRSDLNEKIISSSRTTNLFNPLAVISGQGIDNDGNIVVGGTYYSNWKTSGYIPVTAGESYYLTCKTSGRSSGFQWADSNFQKISGSGDPIYNVIQTAPANAAYFMFNIAGNNGIASTEVMMIQGTAAATYIPYRLISAAQVEGLNTQVEGINTVINSINSINTQQSQQLLGIPKVFSSVALNQDFLISGIKAIYLDLSNSTKTRQEISSIYNVLKNYNGRYEVWFSYSDNTHSEIPLGRQTSADEVVKVILANGIIVYIAVDWSYFSEGINDSLSGILSDWCFFKGAFAPIINTQVEGINTQVEGLNTQVEGITKSIGSRSISNNLLNPNDSNVLLGYYLDGGTTLTVFPNLDTTGYMPVTPGKTYSLFIKPGTTVINSPLDMRFVNFYNSNKVLIRTIPSVFSITPSDGEAFVRVSIYNGNSSSSANMRSLSDISFADNSLTSVYEEYGLTDAYLKNGAGNEPDSIVDRKTLEEYSGISEYLTIENSDKILFTGCSYDESTYSLKFKSWINKLSNYIDWQCGNHAVSGQRIIDIAQRLRADVSTYGIVPTAYKPTYITIANNGNEYLPTRGESLELYAEQVRIAKEIIESLGAKMILGTNHHVDGNPYVETDLKAMAEQLGIPYMGIGWLGEKIISRDYRGFWGGSHPGTRTNSFVWLEWLRFINQLPTPRKVIKVFRGRNSGTDVLALNYDNNWQRATIWQEINAGERSLNTADGSENFYDRLDEGTTVDPNDENHIITNYTGQTNNNEYVALLSNTNVAFTDKVLLEFIINKVNVDKFTATIKGDTGISWYVKDNNNQDTWERIVRDAGLVFKVSKAVYDSFNDAIGTKFTSTKFANGTIQFAYWGKVKSWTMGKGYFLCFTADTSSTDKVSGSGTLVRVSDSTTVDFINHMAAYKYSYDYFSRIHKPKGKFVAINSTYDALTGLYTIIIGNQKYFQYDRVKLIGVKSGSFNISKVEAKYDGGQEKVYKTENVTMKKQLKELITTRGFDTGWDSTGGWVNENNQLVEMPADVDSYPPYLTVKKHVVLALDSVDGFPQKIKKTFTVEASRAYRKVLVRLVSRLFPLIYNVDKTGTYYTSTPQISKTSFDNAVITCELGGTTPAVKHAIIDTDWSEVEFEFELPPYLTTFDLSIYRNIEISNISPSQNWELQLADVSLQIEDY